MLTVLITKVVIIHYINGITYIEFANKLPQMMLFFGQQNKNSFSFVLHTLMTLFSRYQQLANYLLTLLCHFTKYLKSSCTLLYSYFRSVSNPLLLPHSAFVFCWIINGNINLMVLVVDFKHFISISFDFLWLLHFCSQ